MRLGIWILLYACGVAWQPSESSAQTRVVSQPLTEAEAVARLMANDARVRALNLRMDEVRARQAERALFPNPSVIYSREHVFDGSDTFLLARQELPIMGRRGHLQTAGRRAVEVAQAEARFAAMELQAEVRRAYTGLLAAQVRADILRGAIDASQQLISVLRTREKEGEGSTYDRMRGERALIDLDAELTLAEVSRAQAQAQLASFLGPNVLPESLVASDVLDGYPPAPPIGALLIQALTNRGDYRSTELSIAQFEAERLAATRLRLPTPTLTGGLKHAALARSSGSGYQFSVDFALPLFSHGQEASALASAQKMRAEAEAASWRARIETEVRAAHTVLSIQQQRAARFRQSTTDLAQPLARVARVGYEEGELGILELLDAERQALEARLRVAELNTAARTAAIDLDRAIGREFRP